MENQIFFFRRLAGRFQICLIIFLFLQLVNNRLKAEQLPITVTKTMGQGSFPLVSLSKTAKLIVDEDDAEVVLIAAEALCKDIELVSDIKPELVTQLSGGPAVFVGTIGKSSFIDTLIAEGKISADNIRGEWETFCLSVISNPFTGIDNALVIYGSDPRATVFGIFEFSKMIGISPWVWWADVIPEKTQELYVSPGKNIYGPPSVKYRGIFINDEDWGLQPWAANNMDPGIRNGGTKGDIGPNTYEKVFELMLRLKANYLWPAMHECTKAFWYYKENSELALKYQIVLGASHCEPLLRNNVDEWTNNFTSEYGYASGSWNWAVNKTNIIKYWTDRVIGSKSHAAVYTVGMRGIHDSGLPGYSSTSEKVTAMKDIIATQRNILSANLEKPASEIPQIFCPYKEALTLYRSGIDLADDITLAWADDNHGYIRQLSNPQEQLRSGGAGVYYHFSYWGAPEDFLWLSTVSPSLISFEMSKAYHMNAKRLWVFNVGDIKPAEAEMQFAMDLAWDVEAWSPEKAHLYVTHWAKETFGEEFAESIGQIKSEYYRLAAAGKPEHLTYVSYSDAEIDRRLDEYAVLVEMSKAVETQIPERLKDAHFQLIAYPVEGAASMNEKTLCAYKSRVLASQGNLEALTFADKSNAAYQNIIGLTNKYNKEIANGKWDGMMNYAPRGRSYFYEANAADANSISRNPVPADDLGTEKVISADKFTKKNEAGFSIQKMNGLGTSASAMTVWPLNLKTYEQADITSAPYLEYNIPVAKGNNKIKIKCLPTFPLYEALKLRYAVSIDGGTPTFVNLKVEAEDAAWSKNVLQGYSGTEINYTSSENKDIPVRIYFTDAGVVLDAIVITTPSENSLTSYIKNPSFEYKAEGELNDGSVIRGKPYAWEQTGDVVGNSYGINKDGSNYDGNNSCWYNANQPPYALPEFFELYQIINDIPAGDYILRCRLSTNTAYQTNVRLFANNNVQYYGKEADYEKNLTAGEINTFAGHTGGSVLNEMAVKFSIIEGETLKLGIRSSNLKSDGTRGIGTNASNVYGFFRVDYFRLESVGSNLPIEKAKELLDSLIHVSQQLLATTANNNTGEYTKKSDFETAIAAALAVSENPESKTDDYMAAKIELEIMKAVYERSFVAYNFEIINPDFEYKAEGVLNDGSVVRGMPYGWQQLGEVQGNSFGISKDAANYVGSNICWYSVNASPYAMPENFELYQLIGGLKAGIYKLNCRLAVQSGQMTNVRLFANNNVQYYGKQSDYDKNLTDGEINTFAGWTGVNSMASAYLHDMSVEFELPENEVLRLGIRSSNLESNGTRATGSNNSNVPGGFKVDHFQLERVGDYFPSSVSYLAESNVEIYNVGKELRIMINGNFAKGNILVYSMLGEQLLSTAVSPHESHISISLLAGVYVVKTIINMNETIQKVLIK